MSYSTPQEKFHIIFEEFHRRIPKYLKGVTAQWVEALSQNKVTLSDMIRPGNDPVEVDFLASFDPSIIDILEQKTIFNKETIQESSAKIRVIMGQLFSNVFASIANGSMQLTKNLFALTLLHLPLDQIVPQMEETERYLVDALRLNSIDHWDLVTLRLRSQRFQRSFQSRPFRLKIYN
jgi:hypothetical protein